MKKLVWGLLVAGTIWIVAPYVIKNEAKANHKVIGTAISTSERIEADVVYYRVHDGVCEFVVIPKDNETANVEMVVSNFKLVESQGIVKIFF